MSHSLKLKPFNKQSHTLVNTSIQRHILFTKFFISSFSLSLSPWTEEATRTQVDKLRRKKIDMVRKQSRPTSKKSQWGKDETVTNPKTCGRCGKHAHKGERCPVKPSRCSKCQKIGHWGRAF